MPLSPAVAGWFLDPKETSACREAPNHDPFILRIVNALVGVRTARRFTVCVPYSAAHPDFELAPNNGRLMLPAQMRGNGAAPFR
jgi:hypothetical protein